MIRWRFYENNPVRELLEQVLQAATTAPAPGGRGEPMPINVHQTDSDVFLVAALPGVAPEDVDLSYHDGLLTLHAHSVLRDADYFHQEIRSAEYFRQVMLPVECRFEEAEARLENGLLEVRIPKERPRAPEKIRIQVNRRSGPATIEAAKGTGYREVKATAGKVKAKPAAKAGPGATKKTGSRGAGLGRKPPPGPAPESSR